MKYLIIFGLIISFLSCNVCSKKSVQKIEIDTIMVKGMVFKNICFDLQSSTYPKIKGIEDELFQNQINEKLFNTFRSYLDSAKEGHGCDYIDIEDTLESQRLSDLEETVKRNGGTSIYPTLKSYFYICSKSSDIISVVQYFWNSTGFGGNGSYCEAIVSNFDLKKRKVLKNSDFKFENTDLIDIGLAKYLEKNGFIESIIENGNSPIVIQYPSIKNKKITLNELQYAIRNDSVMLIIDLENYIFGKEPHIVPICKWPIKNSHAIFKK